MTDSGDHYFTAKPASSDERRLIRVTLAGEDVHIETAPGVFSPGRVDLGTSVLLRSVPPPPETGDLLDLGCGWGPLTFTMAKLSPGATVWAIDVNERALDLVRRNAAHLGLANIRTALPDEVPEDLSFDALWSNPPIRVGKSVLHEMMRAWLPRIAPGAEGHLVVQRNLGSDSLASWIGSQIPGVVVSRLGSAKGFRVLRVVREVPRA